LLTDISTVYVERCAYFFIKKILSKTFENSAFVEMYDLMLEMAKVRTCAYLVQVEVDVRIFRKL